MEITAHFVSDLIEEEIRGALAAVAKVASLMDQVLGKGGMRRWSMKSVVDSSICRREIASVIGRIPYKLVPKATVVQTIRKQLEVVFPRRILSVWETNRASFPIIVRGVVRMPVLVEEGIADRLLLTNVDGILWGDRRAYFTYVHGELVLKAEVASAVEVERMIRNGITVEGKKCEVRACTKEIKGKGETATPPKKSGGRGTTGAPMGRWQAGAPSTTMMRPAPRGHHPCVNALTDPAAIRRSGPTQGGGMATKGGTSSAAASAPRRRMLSNVRCYWCG